jgi:hypothetical protein
MRSKVAAALLVEAGNKASGARAAHPSSTVQQKQMRRNCITSALMGDAPGGKGGRGGGEVGAMRGGGEGLP